MTTNTQARHAPLDEAIRTALTRADIASEVVARILGEARAKTAEIAEEAQAKHATSVDPLAGDAAADAALAAARDLDVKHGRLTASVAQLEAALKKAQLREAKESAGLHRAGVIERRDLAKAAFDEVPALLARLLEIIELGEASDAELKALGDWSLVGAEALSRGCNGNYTVGEREGCRPGRPPESAVAR